ncbi:hypothetical protein EDC01DRAFT_436824 [Geopyxis carbonaria]|nr:hypothetical protein EDC01DRAFT_436824 [Geopyxis carbonaria]
METSNPFRRQSKSEQVSQSNKLQSSTFLVDVNRAATLSENFGKEVSTCVVLRDEPIEDFTNLWEPISRPPPIVIPQQGREPQHSQANTLQHHSAHEARICASDTDTVDLKRDGTAPKPFSNRLESSFESPRSLRETTGPGSNSKTYRQSIDADTFKHLMLTGDTSTTHDLSGSNGLGCSALDTNRPTVAPMLESLGSSTLKTISQTSHDQTGQERTDVDAKQALTAPSRRSSVRVRPPPPKPRTRSGGNSSIPLTISTKPQLPTPLQMNVPLPRVADTQSTIPPTQMIQDVPEQKKKLPPPIPLSRRHSVQIRSNPSTQEKNASKISTRGLAPPPPPIRRTKSTSSNKNGIPGSGRKGVDFGTVIHPAPPIPSRSCENVPVNNKTLEVLPVLGEEVAQSTCDILTDLEKLQKEVDELRGKYGEVVSSTGHVINC